MKAIDRVTLESSTPDGMQGEIWTFYLLGDKLVVDNYQKWVRPTKKHKPKGTGYWSRLDSRNSSMGRDTVPFTPDIAAKAKAEWLKKLEATVSVGFQNT